MSTTTSAQVAQMLTTRILQEGGTYDLALSLIEELQHASGISFNIETHNALHDELDSALYKATEEIFANFVQSVVSDYRDAMYGLFDNVTPDSASNFPG